MFEVPRVRTYSYGRPKSKSNNLSRWEAVKDEEKEVDPEEELAEDKEESQEECLAEPDDAKMLILRRVLNNQRSEKN